VKSQTQFNSNLPVSLLFCNQRAYIMYTVRANSDVTDTERCSQLVDATMREIVFCY